MAKRKRFTLKQLGTAVTPKIHGELSDLCWALNRPIADIIREMIESDLSRFKDRHRQAIRDGKKSDDFDEGSHSADL